MIRLPVMRGTYGDDDPGPSTASTWRVEWDRYDDDGKELPPKEYMARFVTTYGTVSRRIRLRLSDPPVA